jgi:hypothetical protein
LLISDGFSKKDMITHSGSPAQYDMGSIISFADLIAKSI